MTTPFEARLLELMNSINTALVGLPNAASVLRLEEQSKHTADRLAALEKSDREASDTYVEDLKKKLIAQEGSQQHWVRYVVGVVVSVALVVLSILIGYYAKK